MIQATHFLFVWALSPSRTRKLSKQRIRNEGKEGENKTKQNKTKNNENKEKEKEASKQSKANLTVA